jgi:NAD+ kinase
MKKIGIIANYQKKRAPEVLAGIWSTAKELGLELYADECTAELLTGVTGVSCNEMFEAVDVILALGGDGTMLRAVRELNGCQKPVIGFNIGALGFMTSVSEDRFDEALECLAKDDYTVTERMLLHCGVIRDGEKPSHYHALNEAAVTRGPTSRIITLELLINGESVTTYTCDGLIAATPTGSTGHSLSAGGPILSPETSAFVISLICPHTLSSRPLVLPASSDVIIRVVEGADIQFSVDGQVGESLQPGDEVEVRSSERTCSLINLPGYSYYDVLRHKLGWRGKSI